MSEEKKVTKRPWWKPSIRVTIFLVLFGLWWGVPTFLKWRADVQVKELCAKDGGVKVYETVTLLPEMFDKWGNPILGESYLMKTEKQYIQRGFFLPDIWKLNLRIIRRSDNKLLGYSVSYTRFGGDPIGPWHGSSYSCPKHPNIEAAVFRKVR